MDGRPKFRIIGHHPHYSLFFHHPDSNETEHTHLASAAVQDNEVPLQEGGHHVILKEIPADGRTTKDAGSQLFLRIKRSIGGLRRKEKPVAKMAATNGTAANGRHELEGLSTLDQIRTRVGNSIGSMFTLLEAIRAPLPTETGDGSPLPPVQNESPLQDLESILKDVRKLGINKVEDLAEVVAKAKFDQPLDDKKYLMEHLIQAAASLPNDVLGTKITNTFLTTLWDDLSHPPQTLLSPEFNFRQPDGSKNSFEIPQVGAAGMPYARTVTPKVLRAGSMPDPGLLFDAVMARKDTKGTQHPNKISSVLFYLASIIIHDCFKTNRQNYNLSDTSSYLDLAPLYGSNWEDQKRMRTMKDGKLKPDCFSETRLLAFPPGVGALLIMFNRYHNYIVEQLALINEDGRFTENTKNPIVERYGEKINRRDDDLFQTGRLITCGLYVNIILIDYVRTILNLNQTDSNWQLNPRAEIPDGPKPGGGNQVSCEFNLVYRWHSAISPRDDKWTQDLFHQMFPNASPKDMANPESLGGFLQKLGYDEAERLKQDPMDRQFPALNAEKLDRIKGGPFEGNFADDDVAAILTAGIDDCANAMGPQQVPTVMKAVEILGIMQARTWRVATLNEFRKHFDLEPHRTFESITDNKEVSDALKHLYDTPDQVELYPGLVVEDAKKKMDPGSGLCPSYTTSRGVLSDAVALVRGDRFFTTSYTPAALTNWGYQEASSDLTIDNGCVFYKLFLRALPNNFDPASVYAHYPLTVPNLPGGMQDILKKLGKAHKYNFDRPIPIKQPAVIFSYDAAKSILDNQDAFHVTWGKAMEFLMGPPAKNFMLAGDTPANSASRELMANAIYLGQPTRGIPAGNEKWLIAVRQYYEQITVQLLKEKSYSLAGTRQVDIIRDVGNMAHVRFAAEMFSLPLKTAEFPRGIFSEYQLYLIMAGIFIAVFFDVDPAKSFPLRQKAYDATQILGHIMEVQVAALKSTGRLAETLIDAIKPTTSPLKDYGVHMLMRLIQEDRSVTDLVWGNIMGTMGGMVANQGQLLGQILDFYLGGEGSEHWPEIQKLAAENTAAADDKLMHYLMEGVRLNGETGVFRWVQKDITVVDKPTPEVKGLPTEYNFKSGDKVMVNLKAAGRDPKAFVDPEKVDITRSLESYINLGHGAHQCLGQPMTRVALTTMLKIFAKLENLRPAAVTVGSSPPVPCSVKKVVKEFVPGDLKVLPESWHYHAYLTEDWDMYFPFPTSLKVNWDGGFPDGTRS